MNDKHTPGPWQYWDSNNEPDAEPWYVIDAISQEPTQRGAMIDIMEGRTSVANARLIAAAPALLDALREIASVFWNDHEDCRYCDAPEGTAHDPDALCALAWAAIRMATGGDTDA